MALTTAVRGKDRENRAVLLTMDVFRRNDMIE